MRKFLAIPLLFLYTLAVSGVMVQMHFCGSDLESWNVTAANNACCCENTDAPVQRAEDRDDCCTDKTLIVKTVQDQYLGNGIQLLFGDLQPVHTPANITFDWELPAAGQQFTSYRSKAPPGLWQNIPLFLLHQHIIVYS